MIIWNCFKLFPHIHGYLFSFANTEIYIKKYKTHWKIVKTTFDKIFPFMAHSGFNCAKLFLYLFSYNVPLSLTYIILVKEQLQSTKYKPIFLQEKPKTTINCQLFGCTVYITWSCCILSPLSLILKTSFEYPPVSIIHLLLTSWWPGVARWKFLNRILKK